jgi:glycosyltransferase involved in cell wall biosynthesis
MSVLVVDWLGRGGIAQTSEAWVHELDALGVEVHVVTRADRELGEICRAWQVESIEAGAGARRSLAAHREVVRAATVALREQRPSCVVVQNYIVPVLEEPLYRAAREVGARVVVVAHDHRPHSFTSGNRAGWRRQLRRADVVVAHSRFVGEAVARWTRKSVELVPHPLQVGMLARSGGRPAFACGPELLAVHFGTLRRRYKGSNAVLALAGQVPGWTFGAIGAGAPRARAGLDVVSGWVSSADLVASVAVADATILPYRAATQSGAIVLSHGLGVVPVATAVGGVVEQIDNGIDGVLIAPGSHRDAWRGVLEQLRDDEHRKQLAAAGRTRAERDHAQFCRAVAALTG